MIGNTDLRRSRRESHRFVPTPVARLRTLLLTVCIAVLTPGIQGAAAGQLGDWHQLIKEARAASTSDKVRRVNEFFNRRMSHVLDSARWGKKDYWATPREFISGGAGDCEDFALAKYYTLRKLGVPIHRMRMIYVRMPELAMAHMVLAYYPTKDASPLVLDNFTDAIIPLREREDLLPMFAFNDKGLWRNALKPDVVSPDRLTRWREFRKRVRS
ncbi:MAG: transglutaminase-like cysteine peptidase [Gammaproteobacteria bacterium]|nr:transglutaminase-like cysteine peptidase [Gammaproteobacteria bacterium]